MAHRVIDVKLSANGVRKALNEYMEWLNSLERKNELFVKRLSEIGLNVVNTTMSNITDYDVKGDYYTEVAYSGDKKNYTATIHLMGEKVLFVEFSAGITFGSQPIQPGFENKYGPGTYPSKGENQGLNPNGWWYIDSNGDKQHSYGNRAYRPMYNASTTISLLVHSIAREVFGGN